MAKSSLTDRDRGYRKLMAGLKKLGTPAVYVGILQDKGSEMDPEGNITLAGYAAANEFGVSKDGEQRIPERSFMRSTVDRNRKAYQTRLDEACGAAIDAATAGSDPAAALEQKLGLLGAEAQGDIQRTIRDTHEPPNAPMTLARKYPGNHPLIHTSRMINSIQFCVSMDGSVPKAGQAS
jgi:hypothetical protein